MVVVAIIAILFVGPKELPGMLRTFGKAIKKVRGMAGDFQQQFDSALKDAELDGVKDAINDVRNLDPTKQIKDKLNPLKGDLDKVKKSVEDAADFDPETLFDESKAPEGPQPIQVDVEAALKRQRKLDAEAAKNAKSEKAPAASKAPSKKAAAKKAPAKKPGPKRKPVKKAEA